MKNRNRWIFTILVICFMSTVSLAADSGSRARDRVSPEKEAQLCKRMDPATGELQFAGRGGDEVSNGRIDADLEYDPITKKLWMIYSGVKGGAGTTESFKISQRLAYSKDGGASWCDHSTVLPVEPIPQGQCPPGHEGNCYFNMEVASLVYVPFAPIEKRWKYFWFQVPSADKNIYEFAWYGLREAASPEELKDAATRKIFAGAFYDGVAPIKAWVNLWDGGQVEQPVNRFPGLSDCSNVTEIGTEVVGDHLYVSLVCPSQSNQRILLLRSSDPLLAQWEYVGSVLGPDSAFALRPDSPALSASALFTGKDGIVRIIASPVVPNEDGRGAYGGCAVYQFEDISTAKLVDKDNDGLPDPELYIELPPNSFHAGMCSYHAKASKPGMIFSQQFPHSPRMKILATEFKF